MPVEAGGGAVGTAGGGGRSGGGRLGAALWRCAVWGLRRGPGGWGTRVRVVPWWAGNLVGWAASL